MSFYSRSMSVFQPIMEKTMGSVVGQLKLSSHLMLTDSTTPRSFYSDRTNGKITSRFCHRINFRLEGITNSTVMLIVTGHIFLSE